MNQDPQAAPMIRAIAFELRVHGVADIIEQYSPETPYVYQPGSGELLPAIERGMIGAVDYEERSFVIEAAAAFGPYDAEATATFPRSAFRADVELVRDFRCRAHKANGAIQHMTVLHAGPDFVRVDLNHPFAGKALKIRARFIPVFSPQAPSWYFPLPRGPWLH